MNHIQYENNNINISFCQFWTICFSTAVTSIHLFLKTAVFQVKSTIQTVRGICIFNVYTIFSLLYYFEIKFLHMISWAKLCQNVRYSPSSILNMMKPNNWGLSWAGPSLASAGTGYWNLSLKRFRNNEKHVTKCVG